MQIVEGTPWCQPKSKGTGWPTSLDRPVFFLVWLPRSIDLGQRGPRAAGLLYVAGRWPPGVLDCGAQSRSWHLSSQIASREGGGSGTQTREDGRGREGEGEGEARREHSSSKRGTQDIRDIRRRRSPKAATAGGSNLVGAVQRAMVVRHSRGATVHPPAR